MANNDLFASVRAQAQRALDRVLKEIRRREAELQKLTEQAEQWRVAISGTKPTPGNRSGPKASKSKRVPAKKKRGVAKKRVKRTSPQVDWDAVLAKLPKTFTTKDLAKRTPKLSKHPKSRVIAVARWSRGKQIKKLEPGKYRKL